MDAPQLPATTDFKFEADCSTRWSDEDNLGVLNNAVYLTLLEEARFQYFSKLGLLHLSKQFNFVLGQTNIRFLAPGTGASKVKVAVITTKLGSRSFTQKYRVYCPSTSIIWAEAEAVLVIWDPKNRCSSAMPEEFRQTVDEFEGD
ncbi:MAG: thioesterase family protein [Planctomycetota bacterium]|jgi:acyl-CoA thioester hydrolase|nr:thioesterase family protein [Planctomycetota bacterium]